MLAVRVCSAVRGADPRATPDRARRPHRAACTVVQAAALRDGANGPRSNAGPSPAALKLASVLAAAALALHPLPVLAGEVEKLEGEELPALVEALGSVLDPEQASSAAAQLSEVESELTKLDETEEAKGESAVEEEANAITDAIEALKETLSLK